MAMKLSRRWLIQGAGGAGLALIGAGGYFVATRTPTRAIAAWGEVDTAPPADVRLDAFRHAILAPNPHNRQPWLIKLTGDATATVYCDLARRLPHTDPFDRQILMGFGCFLETARIAAAERGFAMDIAPFPDGLPAARLDARPIARLQFAASAMAVKDPLFAAIPNRRSSKQPFQTDRPVDSATLRKITDHGSPVALAASSNDAALVKAVRAYTWDAWMIELQTQRTWQESVDLMRIGKHEIEANPDGISLGGPFLEVLAAAGQLSREQIAQPGTQAHKSGVDRYRAIMDSGMAYAWITTKGNSRLDQLEAGRVYVRMNLEAARQGLGFHPVSQALQEFPEMGQVFSDVHNTLGAKNEARVQMLVRLGYGTPVSRSPRWPLQSRLI